MITPGEKLKLAPESLRADREVVLAAVAHRGAALRDAAARLKGDRGVVLAAVAQVRKISSWPRSWANFSLLWL